MSKNKLIFQERNYKMKKEYDADKLFVANLERVNSYTFEDEVGPTISSTEQKYIFELTKNGKYREIFTGFLADSIDNTNNGINFKYFDLPYLKNIESFTKYFPEFTDKEIPKLAFIWIMNDLNHTKQKTK